MTIENDVVDYGRTSTRPPGKCLGFANNDVVGKFGTLGNLPWSATAAADQLAAAGQLETGPLPNDRVVFAFYHYVEAGIDYGHVDIWLPSLQQHLADSSRCTEFLNPGKTVGLYPSWGGPIRGFAEVPALGAQIKIDLNPQQGGDDTPPGQLRQVQGDGVTYYEPVGDLAIRIGNGLKLKGRVPSYFDNDGDPGVEWRKGVQRTLGPDASGIFDGQIDGLLGEGGLHGVQEYAQRFGDYKGQIDGDPRIFSWTGFALGLERP